MRAGETLAVLGASGGAGLAAVELGKLMNARVIACASSDEKLAFAKKHGADDTINYGKDDLKDALRRVTGGRGADVIYDPVGGPYTEPALRSIAWQGRFLVVGFAAGDIPKLPLNLVLLKGCDVVGVFWGSWMDRDPQGHRANTEQLLAWCVDGKLSSHIHAIYPLADATGSAQGPRSRASDGKSNLAAVIWCGLTLLEIRQNALRRIAMLRTNVIRHQLDGCGEKGRIIGEAKHRQKVRNGIDRQNKIGECAEQCRLHRCGRFAVKGAIVGGQQLLGEGNRRSNAL